MSSLPDLQLLLEISITPFFFSLPWLGFLLPPWITLQYLLYLEDCFFIFCIGSFPSFSTPPLPSFRSHGPLFAFASYWRVSNKKLNHVARKLLSVFLPPLFLFSPFQLVSFGFFLRLLGREL